MNNQNYKLDDKLRRYIENHNDIIESLGGALEDELNNALKCTLDDSLWLLGHNLWNNLKLHVGEVLGHLDE